MSLFEKVKKSLPDSKVVVSDNEMILLNRKDYHISQISPVHALLNFLGVRVSYPYRLLMALIDQVAAGLKEKDFNIIISDPSLAVAGFYCFVRAGGGGSIGKVYSPKGVSRFPEVNGILGDLIQDFREATTTKSNSKPDVERSTLFTYVLGNTKTSTQTLFAADRFAEVGRGILILKDYGRYDACDEREYLESKSIFPMVTLEGHAFAMKF